MTQGEALYKFFSLFDIPAFPQNSVPDGTSFPWLTYELKTGYFGDIYSCAVNLYFHTDSEKQPNEKAKEIGDKIGMGGIQIPYDGGTIWITRAEPWCTSLVEEDTSIKHRQLMTELEFL